MKSKFSPCLGIISLLFLMVSLPLLNADDAACDIGVVVVDQDSNPKANTPVKLIALDEVGQPYVIEYTNVNGLALFDMHAWPNACPGDVCCPPTWNYGNYRAIALAWCVSKEFTYNTNNKTVYLIATYPCD